MTASPMPADKFWQIIARAAEADHDPDAHVEALRAAVGELSLEEIISFDPSGEPLAGDEAHLARRYPMLWQRFGTAPLLG